MPARQTKLAQTITHALRDSMLSPTDISSVTECSIFYLESIVTKMLVIRSNSIYASCISFFNHRSVQFIRMESFNERISHEFLEYLAKSIRHHTPFTGHSICALPRPYTRT